MAETIKTFVEKATAQWDEVGAIADTLVTAINGLAGDVALLKDTILTLQNNAGPISAEDQALLDAGLPVAVAAMEKIRIAVAAASVLDAATAGPIVEPPPVP